MKKLTDCPIFALQISSFEFSMIVASVTSVNRKAERPSIRAEAYTTGDAVPKKPLTDRVSVAMLKGLEPSCETSRSDFCN